MGIDLKSLPEHVQRQIGKQDAKPAKKLTGGRGLRLPKGEMNKTEAAYARDLERRKQAGEILWYAFEGFKLRLAKNTTYSPDFVVMIATGEIECHEVKGRWEDDARCKIKVAAEQFPFRFIAVTKRAEKHGGGWNVEAF